MPVEAQQDAIVIGELEAGEHIGGGCAGCEHIALGFPLQAGIDIEKRHGGAQRSLLLEQAVAHLDVHGLHQVGHLLFAPQQLLIGGGGHGDDHRHIEQILIPAGEPLLNVIAGLDGTGQFLVVS